ncbi:hypothetical protein ONS95_011354 [Cadophora gregata]|uniref:uncharacterized protein n=1 Tax=Cadophora gregata TaxID=51156 RepID=UPI0026DD08EF|nr:uncharacterized protein ONS95_011354 [Cadophora gregata]KAK0119929.1 hypothetical protein ONS95_011354 [Cadophora gregata]KAK0120962.1 hypothetical protein ONS96_011157 [Cadophora gregata f. sp. sojae]
MAGIARKNVEILIHTTAPSRGQDDALYRRMAEAYLNFQPATHQIIPIRDDSPKYAAEKLDKDAGSQLQEELIQATQASSASYRPGEDSSEEEDAYEYMVEHRLSLSQEQLHSPSMSFRSAVDNADSPVFHAGITHYDDDLSLHRSQEIVVADSFVAPPNEIPDSQPEVHNTMVVFSSPFRMLEYKLQNQESQGTMSTPDKSLGRSDKTSRLELPSGLGEALSSSPDQGFTPSSPSPVNHSGRPLERILKSRSLNPPSSQDPALNLKRKWTSSSSEKSHSSSAPLRLAVPTAQESISSQPLPARLEKRARLEPQNTRPFASSQPLLASSKPSATPDPSSFLAPGIWWEQLEIWPKPPATSTVELKAEMLITPHLALIANKMPPSLYAPVLEKRSLRGMERGYWVMECEGWYEELLQRCWDTLGRCIARDLAGWGVWCVRDEDFKSIRVYCWGVVVKHIYLLLYMASDNRIRKTGARWIGGDGETIIQMT